PTCKQLVTTSACSTSRRTPHDRHRRTHPAHEPTRASRRRPTRPRTRRLHASRTRPARRRSRGPIRAREGLLMAELTDIPEADYFASPRLSQSQAKTLLANPARYKYELTAPREERTAFDVGHAAHTLILGTGAPIATVDVDARRGKAWTEAADAARADGCVPLTRKEAEAVHGMRDAVYDQPGARALLGLNGQSEKTVLWDDEDVPCRARLDRLSDGLILDVKTAADASPDGFSRSAANYGYDVQQVAYTRAVQAATGEAPPFVFLVVEKT